MECVRSKWHLLKGEVTEKGPVRVTDPVNYAA